MKRGWLNSCRRKKLSSKNLAGVKLTLLSLNIMAVYVAIV